MFGMTALRLSIYVCVCGEGRLGFLGFSGVQKEICCFQEKLVALYKPNLCMYPTNLQLLRKSLYVCIHTYMYYIPYKPNLCMYPEGVGNGSAPQYVKFVFVQHNIRFPTLENKCKCYSNILVCVFLFFSHSFNVFFSCFFSVFQAYLPPNKQLIQKYGIYHSLRVFFLHEWFNHSRMQMHVWYVWFILWSDSAQS